MKQCSKAYSNSIYSAYQDSFDQQHPMNVTETIQLVLDDRGEGNDGNQGRIYHVPTETMLAIQCRCCYWEICRKVD